jgi:tetratricopeptide (TPR) repeat protein
MPLLILFGALVGLSLHTVVNCGDQSEPDVCSAVIGFSPLHGAFMAFAFEGRARIAMRHGDHRGAIADLDRAVRLDPNRAAFFRERGIAHRQGGELALAIADLDQAIALDPKRAAPYTERGLALAASGDLDRAILSYSTAIRLAPSDADARVNRGLAYLAQGRAEDARADFEAALRLPPRRDDRARETARQKLDEHADPARTEASAPPRREGADAPN